MFNHLEITKREETAEIIRSLSRKIKIVEDIKNEDGTIDALEYLADLEKRIYQSKQENLIKELFEWFLDRVFYEKQTTCMWIRMQITLLNVVVTSIIPLMQGFGIAMWTIICLIATTM